MSTKERGVVGLLLTDQTVEYLETVLKCLSSSVYKLEGAEVDLYICYRGEDKVVQKKLPYLIPANVRETFTLEVKYDLLLKWGKLRMPPDIVSQQRNVIREFAIKKEYDWVFYLDMAVCLQPSTLQKLLSTQKEIIGVPYRTDPWPHPCVFFFDEDNLPHVMMNPNKIKLNQVAYPCAGFEFGATLVRQALFDYPFIVKKHSPQMKQFITKKVCFESGHYGLFKMLKQQNKTIYYLCNHTIQNLEEAAPKLWISEINDSLPLYLDIQDSWILK